MLMEWRVCAQKQMRADVRTVVYMYVCMYVYMYALSVGGMMLMKWRVYVCKSRYAQMCYACMRIFVGVCM